MPSFETDCAGCDCVDMFTYYHKPHVEELLKPEITATVVPSVAVARKTARNIPVLRAAHDLLRGRCAD